MKLSSLDDLIRLFEQRQETTLDKIDRAYKRGDTEAFYRLSGLYVARSKRLERLYDRKRIGDHENYKTP